MTIQPNRIAGVHLPTLTDDLTSIKERMDAAELGTGASGATSLFSTLVQYIADTNFRFAKLNNASRFSMRNMFVDGFNDAAGLETDSKQYLDDAKKKVYAVTMKDIAQTIYGGTWSASSTYTGGGGQPVSNVFDGDDATYHTGNGKAIIFIRDFGSVKHNISRIRLYKVQSELVSYSVSASNDGVSWTVIASKSGMNYLAPSPFIENIYFDNYISARYIKVELTNYSAWVNMNSINIYQAIEHDQDISQMSNGGTAYISNGANLSAGSISDVFDGGVAGTGMTVSSTAWQVTRDLGVVKEDISRVLLQTTQSIAATTAEMKIEVSTDDVTYTEVGLRSGIANGGSKVVNESISFTPVSARYIRVSFTNAAGNAAVQNVQIFQSLNDIKRFEIISLPQTANEVPEYAMVSSMYTGVIDFYISRDNGVTWLPAHVSVEIPLHSQPEGNQLRVKAKMQADSVMEYIALSWR